MKARRRAATWLRSLRGRLVVTYVLAATVLAAIGVTVLTLLLQQGLRSNVDAGLRGQAAIQVADITASVGERQHPAPVVTPVGSPAFRTAAGALAAFTATIDPRGRLTEARPTPLPEPALAGADPARPPAAPVFRTVSIAGAPFRVLIVPVHRGSRVWLVVAGTGLAAVDEASSEIRQALLIATPIVLVAVGLGAWLLSGGALRPVERLRREAQRLGERDAAGRLTLPGTRDSLDALAATFNGLLDRLHRSLDRQRALVADAGHDLRTPLAVLQVELETAARPGRTRDDLIESIGHARVEVARLAALADDLLLLAQADGGRPMVHPELSDVGDIVQAAVRAVQDQAHGVTVEVVGAAAGRGTAPLIAEVDPGAVRRILDNLLANALRHTPPDGTVTVSGQLATLSDRQAAVDTDVQELRLQVSDSGRGFDPEFLPYAFERFARADGARGRAGTAAGSGLGLAIVRTLATAHGGWARATNGPSGGAVVEVGLRCDTAPDGGDERPHPPQQVGPPVSV